MRQIGVLLCVLVGWSFAASPAQGQNAAEASAPDARSLYKEATAHFALGEFGKAAEKYQEAYRLKQDPALLYNAAQAFRLAGNYEKALILYKNYLVFYPDGASVKEVKVQIAKLKETLATMEHAKTAPPVTTAEPAGGAGPDAAGSNGASTAAATPVAAPTPVPVANTAALEAGAPAAATVANVQVSAAPAAVEPSPFYKKWWFWTAVGAVVVGGTVTAIALASSGGGSWSTGSDFGPGVK